MIRKLALAIILCASQAHADPLCFPKEAGGTGTNFKQTAPQNGKLYTWWCGKTPQWVALTAEQDSGGVIVGDAGSLNMEIRRMDTKQGDARYPNLLKPEAIEQLRKTRPAGVKSSSVKLP